MLILVSMETAPFIFTLIGVLLVGGILGFVISRKLFKRELEKNPPINEKMIRVMFQQMGRKPSEAQIRAIMNSMKKHQ